MPQGLRQALRVEYGDLALDQAHIEQALDATKAGGRRGLNPQGQVLIAQAGIALEFIQQLEVDGVKLNWFHISLFFE
jgi:hypothetical protein